MQEAAREAFFLCSELVVQEANHESNSMDTERYGISIGDWTGDRDCPSAPARKRRGSAGFNFRTPHQKTYYPNFELDVMVNGRPLAEYYARGRTYVEALQGAEYELRVRNSSPDRVAVALSVDGLNTIDARHTSAWNASKWVIEPYQTITISGWQMSSERARRFYFTNERDSYGAKLGQTANLGVISAVFFRERRRVMPVTPPYPITRDKIGADQEAPSRKVEKWRSSE